MQSEECSEMCVRKDMAEKKLEVLTRDSDERVDKVQRQLDETRMRLRKKEKYINFVSLLWYKLTSKRLQQHFFQKV